MLFIIFFYSQIVHAVVAHERALKAQAKKMNVDSLRSNQVTISFQISISLIQNDPEIFDELKFKIHSRNLV